MSFLNVLYCFIGAAAVTYLLFQDLDIRGSLFLAIFLISTELFLQLRWRLKIVCHECGFDPVLYLRDSKAAVQKVQLRLDERKNNPLSLFLEPLDLPKRKRELVGTTVDRQA